MTIENSLINHSEQPTSLHHKGYLAPIGLAFLIVVISNVVAQAGLAAYFPWTIPALFISNVPLGFASIAILTITGITGFVGTVAWWRFAEQQ